MVDTIKAKIGYKVKVLKSKQAATAVSEVSLHIPSFYIFNAVGGL